MRQTRRWIRYDQHARLAREVVDEESAVHSAVADRSPTTPAVPVGHPHDGNEERGTEPRHAHPAPRYARVRRTAADVFATTADICLPQRHDAGLRSPAVHRAA